MKKDHYTTLGISIYASPEEVRRAFRRLAHRYHPDKSGTDVSQNEQFSEILVAYQILSDSSSRKQYNRQFYGDLFKDERPDAVELLSKTTLFHDQVVQTDPFRYDEEALFFHFYQLLQLAIELRDSGELNSYHCSQVTDWLLPGLERLPAKKVRDAGSRLAILAGDNPIQQRKIMQLVRWLPLWGNRQLPIAVALIVTIILVIILFFWLPA